MVPPEHLHPHPLLGQDGQLGEGLEGTAGDDGPVLEPEVEQVTHDEQPVAKRGHGVEELVERFLVPDVGRPQVRIAHHHHTFAAHAPIMLLRGEWRKRLVSIDF